MLSRVACVAMIGLFAAAPPTGAQTVGVPVRGVAFDSLRGEPLRDAMVAIMGIPGSVTTDARGRFSFASVPPGTHTFVVQHFTLDSLGFSGLSKRVTVTSGPAEVQLAVPSFAALWRAACGVRPPPSDSGLVYGTIRHISDGRPAADAFVDLTWIDVSYQRARGVRQRAHRGETRADSTGSYVVCGVPNIHWLRIDAGVASGASGRIDLPPVALRIQRRDLMLGFGADADSTRRGTITGQLTDVEGGPFVDARVVLDDSMEVRSGADGRFTLRNVAAGTRQVEVFSIGVMPVVSAVDVFPGDTAALAVQLRKVTTLDVVQVTASRRGRIIAAGITERRRSGFAHTMELGELVAHSTMATVFNDFPSAWIEKRGGDFRVYVPDGRGTHCSPHVWIDGARSDYAALNMMRPRDVTAVEMFTRPANVPMQYRPTEVKAACGVILVWTNWAFSK